MKLKNILMINAVIIFSFNFGVAIAQDANQEVYPEQISIEHNQAVKDFSSRYVSTLTGSALSLENLQQAAAGTNQFALINMVGDNNIATLIQTGGIGNAGLIDILGDQNKASLNQNGSDLLSILEIKGNLNQFNMDQLGSNLQKHVLIDGTGLQFDAEQTNAGFKLMQTGTSIPFTLEQNGGSLPIIISNN